MYLQEILAHAGAIELLLEFCKSDDTDVIECATAGLVNLVTLFEPNAVRLGHAGGVEILTGQNHCNI